MAGLFIVIAHVMVFGQVAASNISANQADPQVQPIVTQFHAFGAAFRVAWSNVLYEINVRAGSLFGGSRPEFT